MEQLKTITAPSAKIIRTGDGGFITVVMGNESLTIRACDSQENFDRALDNLKNENWDALYQTMRPVKHFAQKIEGVSITKEGVYFNGEPLHTVLTQRIMEFALANLPVEPLCRFLNNLMANPSSRATNELYRFLEHLNLPITDNGNFLAYKGVQSNWYSVTGTKQPPTLLQGKQDAGGHIYNGIGEVIEIPRNQVDDNKDQTCSYGLHAGTIEYASTFGPRCVIVEINPADVVSIPSDCNGQKLRTCKYKVVGECEGALNQPLYATRWDKDVVEDVYSDTEDEMEFEIQDSSWIESVEWSPEDGGTLRINKYDGTYIEHVDVERSNAEIWRDQEQLCYPKNNGSAGKWYNRNIRPFYS